MTTDQKSAIAETAIIHAAVTLGVGVFKPITDGERYDLILDLRPRLVRVQCKWAVRRGDVVVVTCRSSRRGPRGMIQRLYTAREVDAVAAYCAETDRCYFVPIERVSDRPAIWLRLAPTRNNQRIGVNWADDFDFEATLRAALEGP
jgi:hypothetical protein